jgi:hypothetical protein
MSVRAVPEGLERALRELYVAAKEFFSRYDVSEIVDTYNNVAMGIPPICVQVKEESGSILVEAFYDCRLSDPPIFSAIVTESKVRVFRHMPGAAFFIDYVREYIEGLVNAKEVDGDERGEAD